MVQVGCTINYGRRGLWKETEECACVDYPRNVGENEMSSSLDPEFSGFITNRGPVAQLGARFHGMEEVVGSIPTRSTNFHLADVGRADNLRLDFDWSPVRHGLPYLVDLFIRYRYATICPVSETMGSSDGAVAVGESMNIDVSAG